MFFVWRNFFYAPENTSQGDRMTETITLQRERKTFLNIAEEKGIQNIENYICILNGEIASPTAKIGYGDRAFLVPIVSGG